MTHKQILEKIGFEQLAKAVEEDLARVINIAMSFKKGGSINDVSAYAIPLLLTRWNCVLFADKGVSQYYKEKVALTLAILFHKYGLSDKSITDEAIKAIDKLNDDVVLSDDFFNKSGRIKDFLKTKPSELKRKPRKPDNLTFFRANDIVSIKLDVKYYVAYIHKLTGVNEAPILEFYDGVFETIPEMGELNKLRAKGQKFNDGKMRIANFAIYGMKYQPDLAGQIHLIGSDENIELKPNNSNLEESIGLFTVSNLFFIQETIKKMFYE
ncbi:hypothetical protein ACFSTE_05165 [Aquimarina hainanensis]|uniref:Uncharacterized protein n=1 Tax=Aquimarina hainanensis TaxID=1578017 RepID=A0ABW5N531_9FLAO|nr:hypothetical protein [Aquimarina sp. TRL1]QKX06205.1 hypothetical protein HN014_15225 [Aquimarina sp. TRL1]